MNQTYSLPDCFSRFSVVPRRGEMVWSARNEEAGIVAVIAHRTKFDETFGVTVYDQGPLWAGWESNSAAVELIEDLRWARDNVGGRVRVILSCGSDDYRNLSNRAAYTPSAMTVYVDTVNETTGSFRLIVR